MIHDKIVVKTIDVPIINRRTILLRYFIMMEIIKPFNDYEIELKNKKMENYHLSTKFKMNSIFSKMSILWTII